ncbi:MAG: hypothetical protein E7318_05635 [Clostridiales bacterium]|nr:hypothetical protein [Clostridiales bacterium]
MNQSAFQFSNPILTDVSMSLNRRFRGSGDIEIPAEFRIKIRKKKEEREAIVELTVELGADDNTMPFHISISEGSKFMWCEAADDKAPQLLKHNAPALLLGYIRPIVATLTAASPYDTYNIPFVDFTKDDETLDFVEV